MSERLKSQYELSVLDVLTPPTPPACARSDIRRFTAQGRPWLVYEDGSAFGPALIFYGPGIARRVRCYPENWIELPDEKLQALSLSP